MKLVAYDSKSAAGYHEVWPNSYQYRFMSKLSNPKTKHVQHYSVRQKGMTTVLANYIHEISKELHTDTILYCGYYMNACKEFFNIVAAVCRYRNTPSDMMPRLLLMTPDSNPNWILGRRISHIIFENVPPVYGQRLYEDIAPYMVDTKKIVMCSTR